MAGKYDAVATRALATITKKGGDVVFATSTGGVYDPLTDTFTGGATSTVTGKAVQIEDDPERFAALNLVLTNPITLLVAAKDLDVVPAPGMAFSWSLISYTVKDVEAIDPAGDGAVLYTVIGAA